jgi:hypothetical protein
MLQDFFFCLSVGRYLFFEFHFYLCLIQCNVVLFSLCASAAYYFDGMLFGLLNRWLVELVNFTSNGVSGLSH